MKQRTLPKRAPKTLAQADAILSKIGIFNNSYFEALRNGSMTLKSFQKTQEQFYFAVVFFARPMAALAARFPDPTTRLDILHNVVEEHGDFDQKKFHATTFQTFLKSIGSNPNNLQKLALWPELRAFNSTLTTACLLDEVETGIGCMGMIEYAFAEISAIIGKAVVKRGWVKSKDLVHYKLHSKIDKRHAEEFFVLVEPAWKDKSRYCLVEQGLELGAYIFDRLYHDLYQKAVDSKRVIPDLYLSRRYSQEGGSQQKAGLLTHECE